MTEDAFVNDEYYFDDEGLSGRGLPLILGRSHFAQRAGLDEAELIDLIQHKHAHYEQAMIPKKSGGRRILWCPDASMKKVQKYILREILEKLPVSPQAMGFVRGRSILENARIHIGKQTVINMDLQNFFPGIHYKQVYEIFHFYGYDKYTSDLLTSLCTFNKRLPQGAPTSPALSNLVCLKLDKRLAGLASVYHADYSRYADDITFSGNYGIDHLVQLASGIIADEGFRVNWSKTRIAYEYQKQMVTGLNVNDGCVTIDKKYLKKLRQEIYYCRRYGVRDARAYKWQPVGNYKQELYGKACFVYMVDREAGRRILEELGSIDWDG